MNKCEIEFYLALSAEQTQRNEILQKIPARIDSFGENYNAASAQLLKARVLALLAQTDSAYGASAEREFALLAERSDMAESTVFRMEIERSKLLGSAEAGRLRILTEHIAKSKCAEDAELILSLAFLQRRFDLEGFEKTVQRWPQIENSLGSLILTDLSAQVRQGRLSKEALEKLETSIER